MLLRVFAGLTAALAWGALGLQFWLILRDMTAEGASFGGAVWRYVGYFTILTNLLVAATLTHAAIRPLDRSGIGDPRFELAVAAGIVFVGLVYVVALEGTWDPQGPYAVADTLLHKATPVAFTAFWLMRRHGGLLWRQAWWCVVWPLAYMVYALARGAADGWYAYWFFDPANSTPEELMRNVAVLTATVLVIGLAFVGVDRLLARISTAR